MVILLYILLVVYMIYGIVHVWKNKQLTKGEKLLWVICVIFMPVIGTFIYLRSTFAIHHGRW
jgi:cell division protein FtsL